MDSVVLVLLVPEQVLFPGSRLSAAGLRTPLCTSRPPVPGIAAQENVTNSILKPQTDLLVLQEGRQRLFHLSFPPLCEQTGG